MDIAGVREALHRQPFEPFAIGPADGRSLPVPYPDFVALSARRVILVAEDSSWSDVERLWIVSLDYQTGKKPNGKARGKKKRGGGS